MLNWVLCRRSSMLPCWNVFNHRCISSLVEGRPCWGGDGAWISISKWNRSHQYAAELGVVVCELMTSRSFDSTA